MNLVQHTGHLPLPFDFPVLITARESESSFTQINDLIHHFAKKKPSAKRQWHTILYNLLIECNDSFIMIIVLIKDVHQSA